MGSYFQKFMLIATIISVAPAAVAESKNPAEGGFAVDRLSWLAALIAKLEKSDAPACIGPRGCTANIPEDSPCRKPARSRPDVIVDGVLPGGSPNLWTVGYRLMCSSCYLGGSARISLVRVGKGEHVRILETLRLPEGGKDEFPMPLQMKAKDIDEDGRPDIAVRYRTEMERARKCTGLQPAAEYILVLRAEQQRLTELLRVQAAAAPKKGAPPTVARVRFDDENEDGYPDLIITRTRPSECPPSGRCAEKSGPETEQTVHRYAEAERDWSRPPFSGYALSAGDGVDCDVPLPETPFVTVVETLNGARPTPSMEQKSTAVRAAGFPRACLYKGADFSGLSSGRWYVIAGAYGSRAAAEEEADALRSAGFRPFVKALFQ